MDRFGKFYWMLIGFLLAVIIVLLVLLAGGLDKGPSVEAGQTPGTQATESSSVRLTINNIEAQGDVVVVSTNYCQLKYPYAFSDLIKVEAVNDGQKTALLFTAFIDGQSRKIYELVFNGQTDMFIGSLTLMPGQPPVNVHGMIYQPESGWSNDARIAFIAAQETFHDVVMSLRNNMYFTPAA